MKAKKDFLWFALDLRLPQFRAAPLPSGPVVCGFRPSLLVERGLLVVAIVVVVRVSDILTAVK